MGIKGLFRRIFPNPKPKTNFPSERRLSPINHSSAIPQPSTNQIQDKPFILTSSALKNILENVRKTSINFVRKYILNVKNNQLGLDGLMVSEHKDIATHLFGENFDEKDLTGGKISISFSNHQLIINIFDYSVHFDSNRPLFFDYLKNSRETIRKIIEGMIKEIDPQAKFQTISKSFKEEKFSVIFN